MGNGVGTVVGDRVQVDGVDADSGATEVGDGLRATDLNNAGDVGGGG